MAVPQIFAISKGAKKVSEIISIIGSNSKTAKKLIYFARRCGLVNERLELTDKGMEYLRAYETLWYRRGRMAIKGRDGCFIIFIRKRGVKVLRVPCTGLASNRLKVKG